MEIQNPRKRILALGSNVILFLITYPFRVFEKKEDIKEDPESFLIARLDHIGDVILSTPIYRSLKERYPEARITVLCGSWAKEILENNPNVDSLLVIDCPWWTSIRNYTRKKRYFIGDLLRTIRVIRKSNFQIFVDLRGDIRHILLFGWLTNIPIRISYTRSGGRFLLTHPHEYEKEMHEIEKNYRLFSQFGLKNKYWKAEVYPRSDKVGIGSIKSKLIDILDIENDSYFVIFNGGRSKLRRLALSKISEICVNIIRDFSLKCCYVGDQNDYFDGEQIRIQMSNQKESFLNVCGRLTLLEVRDLIKYSKLFIGTDSSVSHLLASTDTPSISLFGPQEPAQSRPLGQKRTVIYHRYPCSPCLQDTCIVTKSKERSQCMDDITVEEVIWKARCLLQSQSLTFI